MSEPDSNLKPLSGYFITEVANYIAAPATGALLADLGAEVVHVEPIGGDPYRGFRLGLSGFDAPGQGDDISFRVDNRGKRSIALNLHAPEGQEIVHRLLANSDVLVTNFSQTQLTRMDLEPQRLRELYPRLVVARVNAFGFRGPDSEKESFDVGAFWARGGLLKGLADNPPRLPQPRPGIGDHAAAISLVAAIFLALLIRERGGEAPEVRSSLLETALWLNSLDIAGAAFFQRAPQARPGGALPLLSAYETQDGHLLYLQVTHDAGWTALCDAVGHPEWAGDERFNSLGRRRKNADELRSLLREVFVTKPLHQWKAILSDHGVPVSIVNSALDVLGDDQVQARRQIGLQKHPDGDFAVVGVPFELGDYTAPQECPPAPEHGEHGELVLLELGYGWDEITRLREMGVLGPA